MSVVVFLSRFSIVHSSLSSSMIVILFLVVPHIAFPAFA